MKRVYLLAVLLLLTTLNEVALALSCNDKKVLLIARYGDKGQYPTELMDRWSEQSGNIKSFEINSKESFSKVDLMLSKSGSTTTKTISLKLKANKSGQFDFIKLLQSMKERPEKAEILVYQKNGSLICTEEFAVFSGNEIGAVEVINEKK